MIWLLWEGIGRWRTFNFATCLSSDRSVGEILVCHSHEKEDQQAKGKEGR